jgi:hypothetical protein
MSKWYQKWLSGSDMQCAFSAGIRLQGQKACWVANDDDMPAMTDFEQLACRGTCISAPLLALL